MPKRLLDRCRSDSILEFRAAARRRFEDGVTLAAAGRRTGAVYLWGYTAEMTPKAAYFALIGLGETDVITWAGELQPAIARGKFLGITWPSQGAGHNVRAWAELLSRERSVTPGASYLPTFEFLVQSCGRRIGEIWKETLRYRRNVAYAHEVERIRADAEWLLLNSALL
jgi:hypothetical protein